MQPCELPSGRSILVRSTAGGSSRGIGRGMLSAISAAAAQIQGAVRCEDLDTWRYTPTEGFMNQDAGDSSSICKLCRRKLPENGRQLTAGAYVRIVCPRCGRYELGLMAEHADPHEAIALDLHLLSSVMRHRTDRDLPPTMVDGILLGDPEKFDAEVRSSCPLDVEAKLDSMLSCFAERSPYPGVQLELRLRNDYPLAYVHDEQEFLYLYDHLIASGLLVDNTASMTDFIHPSLTVAGWRRIRELAVVNLESRQGFIAMSFATDLTQAYIEGIQPVAEETGYRLLRIDRKAFNDKIDDQIIGEIRRSRFLIADVTGQRAGVYFEAGFAMGLGLPVIWSCRSDDRDRVHFDTRQYNHVFWENPAALRESLTNRILATIGHADAKRNQV